MSEPSIEREQIPLLEGLPGDVADEFLGLTLTGRYARGTSLFSLGDRGDSVHILLSGKVKVTRPSPDGRDMLFLMAGPGDMLGELAVFDSARRQATAVAVQESTAAWIAAPVMRQWLVRHPAASFRMSMLLADRIRRINDMLEDAGGGDVAMRVARALIDQAGRFGRRTQLGLRFKLDLSQDELAHHVRASRERVNQVLVAFSRRGWLLREGNEFVLLAPELLVRRAHLRSDLAARRPSVIDPRPHP